MQMIQDTGNVIIFACISTYVFSNRKTVQSKCTSEIECYIHVMSVSGIRNVDDVDVHCVRINLYDPTFTRTVSRTNQKCPTVLWHVRLRDIEKHIMHS